jgi:serine/threonine-protein kinase
MIINIFRYVVALFICTLLGLFILDRLLIPLYVGTDQDVFLPDCRGESKKNAEEILSNKGLEYKVITLPYTDKDLPGKVVEMRPHPFTKVKKGRIITISIAGHKESLEVPDFRNMTIRKAKIKLMESGFNLDTIMYEYNPSIKEGLIAYQIPEHGSILKSGSYISFHISKGTPKDYFIIPSLINLSLKEAKEKIAEEGLRVGEIREIYQPNLIPTTIIDQGYPANLKVTAPVKIDLDISKDKNEK